MKKKYLLLLLMPLLIICLTGCNSQKQSFKTTNSKTITLEDSKYGKTTFIYEKDEKYNDIKENDGVASKELKFKNDEINVDVQMYYNEMRSASYNDSKTNRSSNEYYKEYKFGKFDAYYYSNYKDSGYINILLDTNENDMATVLFISLDKINYNDDTEMLNILDNKLITLLKTITYEK